jgi:hypothetical protein
MLCIFVFAACGSGGENSQEKFRLVQASPELSAIDFELGSDVLVEEIAYGDASGFVDATEGKAVPLRVKSDLSVLPLYNKEIAIAEGSTTSAFFIGEPGAYDIVSVKEDFPRDTGGKVSFRVANMSPTVASVDVYLLVIGTEIEDTTPLAKAVAYKTVQPTYVQFDPGTYAIVYTEAGTTKEVRVVEGFNFQADKGYTHMLIDKIGGGKPLSSRIIEDF